MSTHGSEAINASTYRTIQNPPTVYPWNCPVHLECGSVFIREKLLVVGFTFTANPNSYIFTGQHQHYLEAERIAWEEYQKAKPRLCKFSHIDPANVDKRGYRNGCGFCKHCGYFCCNVFEPDEICVKCGTRTYWTQDENGDWLCRPCATALDERLTRLQENTDGHVPKDS